MSTDKQVPLTIEDCRCIIEDSETERETRLARAHIELLAALAATREQAKRYAGQRDERARAERAPANASRGVFCGACFTVSWEPTPEGERCGYCWLAAAHAKTQEQLDALKSLKVMQEIVVLREQLAQALRDTERLAGLLPRGLYLRWGSRKLRSREDVDAAVSAKQEPPCWACEGTRLVSNPLCSAPQGSDCPYCRAKPKTSRDATQSTDSIEGEGR